MNPRLLVRIAQKHLEKTSAKAVSMDAAKNIFEEYKKEHPATELTPKDFLEESKEKDSKNTTEVKPTNREESSNVFSKGLKALKGKAKDTIYSAIESGADAIVSATKDIDIVKHPEKYSEGLVKTFGVIGGIVGANVGGFAGTATGLVTGIPTGPGAIATTVAGGLIGGAMAIEDGVEIGGDVGEAAAKAPQDVVNYIDRVKNWAKSKGENKLAAKGMPTDVKDAFISLIQYVNDEHPELIQKYLTDTGEFDQEKMIKNLSENMSMKKANIQLLSLNDFKDSISKKANTPTLEVKHLPKIVSTLVPLYQEIEKGFKITISILDQVMKQSAELGKTANFDTRPIIRQAHIAKGVINQSLQILQSGTELLKLNSSYKAASEDSVIDKILDVGKNNYGKILAGTGAILAVSWLAKKLLTKPKKDTKLIESLENINTVLNKVLLIPNRLNENVSHLRALLPPEKYYFNSEQVVKDFFKDATNNLNKLDAITRQGEAFSKVIIYTIGETETLINRANKGL